MTNIDEYYRTECEKIDASDVNAYVELKLDEAHPTELTIDSSWGGNTVDLTNAVKAAETITNLQLEPEDNPVALCYEKEDGTVDAIHGDDLSRIISMAKLKDVDQSAAPTDGIVYMFDGNDQVFKPFNLKQALIDIRNEYNASLDGLRQEFLNALNQTNINVANLTAALDKPENIPDNARVVWGNINLISDYTNTDNRDWGLYTHDKTNNIPNDEYFA